MIGTILALAIVAMAPTMPLSISTTDDALAVLANPAALADRSDEQLCYLYDFPAYARPPDTSGGFWTNSTFVGRAGPLAAFWEPTPTRFGLALGAGSNGLSAGIRYVHDTFNHWDLGLMSRPWSWLSVGGVWQDFNRNWGYVTLGAAVRPFGDRLTIFGQEFLASGAWPAVGLEVEPLNGVKLGLRLQMRGSGDVGIGELAGGLTVNLGRFGLSGTYCRPALSSARAEYGGLLSVSNRMQRTFVPARPRHLDLRLSGPIADQTPGLSLSGGQSGQQTWCLLNLLARVAQDKSIRALVLDLSDAQFTPDQAQEMREALIRFKAGDRKVYVYGASLGMATYYVASLADRIVVHPLGDVSIPGVSAQVMFLKGTLDKLGLKADYTRHGKYKSAVEQFSQDSLTLPNREQYTALVDTIYEQFVDGTSAGRHVSSDSLRKLIDIGLFTVQDAKAAGLVDTFCYRDEFDSVVRKDLRGLGAVSEKGYRQDFVPEQGWQPKPAIAIIYASGDIADGESHTDFLSGSVTMGAQTMVRAIRDAAGDKRVKAIVLRINSPGGDGYASDLIWHELDKARKKKPVIVSMGDLAASGGYYIACNASRIFAEPNTVTGSIGVFDLKLVTEGLYNKLGARRQVVKQGEHADALSDQREWTPEEDSMMQAFVDKFYQDFIGRVAQGRHMTKEQVDSIAQGRVWTGADGKRVGIVDELGGFLAAVDYAKKAAKLKDCDYVFLPRPKSGFGVQLGTFIAGQVLEALR
jgi:protease-4